MHLLDIAPTLLDVMGVPPGSAMQGKSLLARSRA
jgi:arylsulfatase A-like enzyme